MNLLLGWQYNIMPGCPLRFIISLLIHIICMYTSEESFQWLMLCVTGRCEPQIYAVSSDGLLSTHYNLCCPIGNEILTRSSGIWVYNGFWWENNCACIWSRLGWANNTGCHAVMCSSQFTPWHIALNFLCKTHFKYHLLTTASNEPCLYSMWVKVKIGVVWEIEVTP